MRRKNLARKGVKREVQEKDQQIKANVRCYECNKKRHYKLEYTQLKDKEEKPKKSRKKAVLKAIWDESSLEELEGKVELRKCSM